MGKKIQKTFFGLEIVDFELVTLNTSFYWENILVIGCPKMEKKIEKMFFHFEIIAFELVALNSRFYWENILVIGCQYGKKESQDVKYFQKSVYGPDSLWK